ncbi:transcriptional regulator, AbrB family [Ferroglobus placidus DSM 10642]|uniref:Transcriptional regulator, AbrB family n=1 Tax=Ferroglobus placidus (strain DSM 10642 / AEDII12DO) TaxID=589924 RepID=D3RX11_FERPA|nr:AbrB/MazE/SpoVT family DNA-binding domain-containing protein [Ferroglobus placidus]ADC65024.1 transcriptional regulator, AbrB family [Ferroglobus placidus DSM 10642]
MRVKITRNYQITIPAEVRKKMGLKIGDLLEVEYDKNKEVIIIRKVKEERRTLKVGRRLTPEDIENLMTKGLSENL